MSKSLEGRQANFLVSVWRVWHEVGSTAQEHNADSLCPGYGVYFLVQRMGIHYNFK